jgi:predicted TIM-barrel fold metal-dependent hydrolase
VYTDDALRPWLDAVRRGIPELDIVDGHLHVGLTDPSGFQATPEEVLDALEVAGARGVVFPVSDPAGYREANAAVVDLAAAHPARVTAFARLGPADALAEAERCLAAGARGLKLHPRSEDFALDDPRLDDVFALAADRRVPVLVHAGTGSESVGTHARRRAEDHPDGPIVLAHCATGCFAEVVPGLREVPNLLVDTSWWNPSDLLASYHLVGSGQVVHASDVPFNSPTQGAIQSARTALQAGLGPAEVRAVMGGTMARLLAGDPLPRPGAAPPPPEPIPPVLERLYVALCSAVVPMLGGGPPGEGLELARAACRRPSGPHAEVLDSVGRLLDLATRCTVPDPLRPHRTPGFDVVLTAAVVARTPRAPLP